MSQSTNRSHLDSYSIAKEIHDYFGSAVRTLDSRSVVKEYYTHFRAQYDQSSNPTKVFYYRGTKAHSTSFTAPSASTLSGKHFIIHSAPDNKQFAVWYNIDDQSVAPALAPGVELIEVNVSGNDTASLVAFATSLTINSLHSKYFQAQRNGTYVKITTAGLGRTSNSLPETSNFILKNEEGEQKNIAEITISYSEGGDPFYNGEVLRGYKFDIYSGKFLPSLQSVSLSDVQVETKTVSTPQIQNITLAQANTEYVVTFPVNTYSVTVRTRNGKVQAAWEEGKSNTQYLTISLGAVYIEQGLSLTADKNKLYFRTTKPGTVLEIISWM